MVSFNELNECCQTALNVMWRYFESRAEKVIRNFILETKNNTFKFEKYARMFFSIKFAF